MVTCLRNVMYNHIHHLPTLRIVDDRRRCPTPSPGYLKRGEYRGFARTKFFLSLLEQPLICSRTTSPVSYAILIP
jgi:hypothetical protein